MNQNDSNRTVYLILSFIIGLADVVALFVVLGLQVTRKEKELLGIILGGAAVLIGVITLVGSIRDWNSVSRSGDPVITRLRPIALALIVLAVGVILVSLGTQAATSAVSDSHTHGEHHATGFPGRLIA